VLPPDVRAALWPYLEDPRPLDLRGRPRAQILRELLVSNRSIQLNLEALRRLREPREP
jgi:hypothetical protein